MNDKLRDLMDEAGEVESEIELTKRDIEECFCSECHKEHGLLEPCVKCEYAIEQLQEELEEYEDELDRLNAQIDKLQEEMEADSIHGVGDPREVSCE